MLNRQSARLKKLTEDLIEASKASTGSMPVQLEKLELGVFLTQTLGEFEEKITAAGLRVVMHKPEAEVFVNADGRHLWRVVENLFRISVSTRSRIQGCISIWTTEKKRQ